MNGGGGWMRSFDVRKHRPEFGQTCLFPPMAQWSISRTVQIRKVKVDHPLLGPVLVGKTAPSRLVVGRDLVSIFQIELVAPISIGVFLM